MGSTVWSDPAARPQSLATVALAVLAAVGGALTASQAGALAGPPFLAPVLVVVFALAARAALAQFGRAGHGWLADAVMVGPMVVAFLPFPELTGVSAGAGLEYQLLTGLRNLALVGAVLCDRPRAARTSVGSALAVMLFSFSLGKGWGVFAVATLFAAGCAVWLALGYWRSFAAKLPPTAPRRPPVLATLVIGLIAGLSFVVGVLLYPAGARGWLERFVAPEGAEHRTNDAARQALRDANRRTIENLTSAQYGTPAPPAGTPGAPTAAQSGGPAGGDPTSARPNSPTEPTRETSFPLTRAGREPEPAGADRTLFQLQERGPRHVPLITYDQFDGTTWRGDQPAGVLPQVAAEVGTDRSWSEVTEPLEFDLAGGSGTEAGSGGDAVEDVRRTLDRLAVGTRGGGRVVAPQLKPLDREKLLRQLARPAGNGVAPEFLLTPADQDEIRQRLAADPELAARTLDQFNSSREFREAFLRRVLAERGHPTAGLPPEVRTLVAEWTAGRSHGWEQIDALVQGLRGHARHDPTAVIPPGETDPLRYFLVESRRGTDYMFATSAAVLLRHLGYPTRLVGGFYARPEEYSRLTGTTAVRTKDVHYWTQVQTPDGTWVNLEPTPGYEPGAPVYTTSERVSRTVAGIWAPVRHHWSTGLAVVVAAGVVWRLRRRIAERLATLWWHLRANRPAERLVPSTWWLLDRRAAVAGTPRRPGTTLPTWARSIAPDAPGAAAPLATLAEVADRITHAPGPAAERLGRPEAEIRAACRRAIRNWTVGAFLAREVSSHKVGGSRKVIKS